MASVIMSCSRSVGDAPSKKPESGRRTWYEPWVLADLALEAAPSVFLGGILQRVCGSGEGGKGLRCRRKAGVRNLKDRSGSAWNSGALVVGRERNRGRERESGAGAWWAAAVFIYGAGGGFCRAAISPGHNQSRRWPPPARPHHTFFSGPSSPFLLLPVSGGNAGTRTRGGAFLGSTATRSIFVKRKQRESWAALVAWKVKLLVSGIERPSRFELELRRSPMSRALSSAGRWPSSESGNWAKMVKPHVPADTRRLSFF